MSVLAVYQSTCKFCEAVQEATRLSLHVTTDLLASFENANQGDLFIKKAPAATIATLAYALIEIFNSKSKIRVIGIRHGEKMHETLVTKEEILKSEDLGDHFRIKADIRDLNYDKYFSKGDSQVGKEQEYNSSNTELLSKEKLIKILLKLPEAISALK